MTAVQRHQEAPGNGPRDRSVDPRVRVTALVLLTAHLLLVAWLTLRPVSAAWVAPANAEPFATIRSDLARGPEHAVRSIGTGLLPLAPLGVLLPAVGRQLGGSRFASLVRTVFTAAMVSLTVALFQPSVPGQVADVDVVLLNTVGAALVHLVCFGRLRRLLLPQPPVVRTALRQEPLTPTRAAEPGRGEPRGSSPRASGIGLTPRADAGKGRLFVR